MTCSSCKKKIEQALSGDQSLKSVTVDLEAAMVVITTKNQNENKRVVASITETLDKLKYKSRLVPCAVEK